LTGLIEPLGFEICALRTKKAALAGIKKSKYPQVYKLLHDTFHHYLAGETEFFPDETGLIHVSGVGSGKAKTAIVDDDRILVTKEDVMDNKGQVAALLAQGCKAPISYEPFSPSIRGLPLPELMEQLKKSVSYLLD
jgi:2-keto-myo-inositol isomerase